MEVHAHTHTARKKITHYLWEFLMLFLAVFCGFLAEYQLEHKIEKERGREYIKSYREDLCKDTAILNSNIEGLKRNSAAGDSLVKLIQQGRTIKSEDLKKLYEYNLISLGGFSITLTDRTESQLKNAGGMRLITKKKVIDEIVNYWAGKENLESVEAGLQDLRIKAREKSYLIFDNKYYSESSVNGKREILDNVQLMTKDYLAITEFSNRVAHIKNLIKGTFETFLKHQKEKADTLIAIIDKEYHLK